MNSAYTAATCRRRNRENARWSGVWLPARNRNATCSMHARSNARDDRCPVKHREGLSTGSGAAVLALARLWREDVTTTQGRERLTERLGTKEAGARSVIHLAALGSAGALAPLDRDLPMVGLLLEALDRTATSQEG
jgi:hypothetical protein